MRLWVRDIACHRQVWSRAWPSQHRDRGHVTESSPSLRFLGRNIPTRHVACGGVAYRTCVQVRTKAQSPGEGSTGWDAEQGLLEAPRTPATGRSSLSLSAITHLYHKYLQGADQAFSRAGDVAVNATDTPRVLGKLTMKGGLCQSGFSRDTGPQGSRLCRGSYVQG